jgi:hypothetical protein
MSKSFPTTTLRTSMTGVSFPVEAKGTGGGIRRGKYIGNMSHAVVRRRLLGEFIKKIEFVKKRLALETGFITTRFNESRFRFLGRSASKISGENEPSK